MFRSLTTLDFLAGTPLGRARPALLTAQRRSPPKDSLVDVISRSIAGRQAVVEFSGGFDSSLVLAATVRACQEAGWPEPIALSIRHPDRPETDETYWQDAVVSELGVRNHLVLSPPVDDFDVLGEPSRAMLAKHGVIWSPRTFSRTAFLAHIAGTVLLSGEGGDEVLGDLRFTPLLQWTRLAARRRRIPAGLLKRGVRSLLPSRALSSVDHPVTVPWLRGRGRALVDEGRWREAGSSWTRRGMLSHYLGLRRFQDLLANNCALSSMYSVKYAAPLADPDFCAALLRHVPAHDYAGRHFILAKHFGGMLPAVLYARRDKTVFNTVVVGEPSRAFLARWSGSGLPLDLVDPAALRESLLAPMPDARGLLLMQQAWLETEGRA